MIVAFQALSNRSERVLQAGNRPADCGFSNDGTLHPSQALLLGAQRRDQEKTGLRFVLSTDAKREI